MPGLLAATPEAQARVLGASSTLPGVIGAARAMLVHATTLRLQRGPMLDHWQALLDYLRLDQAFSPVEIVRVLHLDTKNQLIRDEVMARGSIDETVLHVREVIRRAVDLHSAAIILVHNHPSGDPAPSRADIALTRSVAEAGKRLGIALHDHIIMAGGGHTSLREAGLM